MLYANKDTPMIITNIIKYFFLFCLLLQGHYAKCNANRAKIKPVLDS